MIDAVRSFARNGGPIYAECGGLMYLSDGIRTLEGRTWPMVGLVAGEAVMSERLQAGFAYRSIMDLVDACATAPGRAP